MKRLQAPGDPGEFGDWIVGVVHLRSDDESGYREAVHDIVAATADMESFLQMQDGDEAHHYTLRITRDGELGSAEHERDFWARAAQFPALHKDITRYVEQVNGRGDDGTWQDEFHPRGSFAIAELALADPRWCALLGRLLFSWDMGHETFQHGLITQLFAKYGLCEETLDLLACRICADGQSSDEQTAEVLYDQGWRERIDVHALARRCLVHAPRSVSADIGLDHFALIYADGDEHTYDAVWSAYRAAGIDESCDGYDETNSHALAARRSTPTSGHWDVEYHNSTVELLDVDALVLL